MHNRAFFPQAALDAWLGDGRIDLRGTDLDIVAAGRTYAIEEAVHVLREVTGAGDPEGLIGRVYARTELTARGAEIIESSMLLGDHAYDVVAGWLGTPIPTFADYAVSAERLAARAETPDAPEPSSDEEILLELMR